MKKVLFVATVTNHINRFHIPYLKWFKDNGYEVHVASKGEKEIPYCDKRYEVPFDRFPLKLKNKKAYQMLKKILEENQYEIIHCHTPVGGVITRLAAKKAREQRQTKVIYTVHGFHFYKGAPIKNWFLYYPIEKMLSRYTDCLITITQEDYEFAIKHFKKVNKIKHINGIGMNTQRFRQPVTGQQIEEIKKELKIQSKDIVLTYVAELNKNKNQNLLISVVKELVKEEYPIKLLLIGAGGQQENYQHKIEENKLQQNSILLGRREDIPTLLSITDIYVASSIREGLPVNIMEAMFMKLPIVASSNRGHRELVENGKNGFIVTDQKEWKEKLIELIKDKNVREKMGQIGYDKVEKYKVEHVIEEMIEIYGEEMNDEKRTGQNTSNY